MVKGLGTIGFEHVDSTIHALDLYEKTVVVSGDTARLVLRRI